MIGDLLSRAVRGEQLNSGEAEEIRQTMLRVEAMLGKAYLWTTQYGQSLEKLANIPAYPMQARLTLETGVPISTTNQTAKTTLYLTPYQGAAVSLYNPPSGLWNVFYLKADSQLSLSGYTASLPYDIFAYPYQDTVRLESVAWTSGTARATSLVNQNGVLCKSTDLSRRYIGTIRTTGTTGQCEDSLTSRLVYNYYNRVPRRMYDAELSIHTYGGGSWRKWNNSDTNNLFRYVVGITQEPILVGVVSVMSSPDASDASVVVNLNGTNVPGAMVGNRNLQYIRVAVQWSTDVSLGASVMQIYELGWNANTVFDLMAMNATIFS